MDLVQTLPTLHVSEINQDKDQPRWLIESIWQRNAVGVIGGAPKSCKSWLGLDLAISVASNTPCLEHFPVNDPGLVLIYLAEDSLPDVYARIDGLCSRRALSLKSLNIHVITSPILKLDSPQHQTLLVNTLNRLKPRLLLLDPLVRLHNCDENSAQEMAALLGFLRSLQRQFNMAVILVHHTSKKYYSHPGQALRGSSDIHAFGDSNAYLKRAQDHLVLTIEHRSNPAPKPLCINLNSSPQPFLELVDAPDTHSSNINSSILDHLKKQTLPISRDSLRSLLAVNNQKLGLALTKLNQDGVIKKSASGWTLA